MPEIEAIWAVRDFVELGGNVLFGIAFLTAVMWTLIIERVVYFRTLYREERERVRALWAARADHSSWHAHQIRRMLVSQVTMNLQRRLGVIKTAVALCPMAGLLGTVTGMIEVFDVMAGGISEALVTTMLGLMTAIPLVMLYDTLYNSTQRIIGVLDEQSAGLIATRSEISNA